MPAVFLAAGTGGMLTGAVTWLVLYRFRGPIGRAFEDDSDAATAPDAGDGTAART